MPDHTEATATVAATPDAVMDAIADVEAYPQWTKGVAEVEVLEPADDGRPARAKFVLDAGPIKGSYTVDYTWAGDVVSWTLVESSLFRSLDGSYSLTPLASGGTDVTYRLSLVPSIPLIGPLRRRAEKQVVDAALGDLQRLVEADPS